MLTSDAANTLLKHCEKTGQKALRFEMHTKKVDNFFGVPVTINKRLPKNKIVLISIDGNTIGAFRFEDET